MGKLRAELVERVHMHPRTTAQWPLTTSPHAVASAQLFVPYVQIELSAAQKAALKAEFGKVFNGVRVQQGTADARSSNTSLARGAH